jgi:hypothetical protein
MFYRSRDALEIRADRLSSGRKGLSRTQVELSELGENILVSRKAEIAAEALEKAMLVCEAKNTRDCDHINLGG